LHATRCHPAADARATATTHHGRTAIPRFVSTRIPQSAFCSSPRRGNGEEAEARTAREPRVAAVPPPVPCCRRPSRGSPRRARICCGGRGKAVWVVRSNTVCRLVTRHETRVELYLLGCVRGAYMSVRRSCSETGRSDLHRLL
jgi:hypothetical protein